MRNLQSIKIRFLVLSSRAKNEGVIPLYCKLTLNKQTNRFATGIRLPVGMWLQEKQKAKGNSSLADSTNARVQEIISKVQLIESQFILAQQKYELVDVIDKLLDRDTAPFRTLLQVYQYNYNQMNALKNKTYNASTIAKCLQMKNLVHLFLKTEYGAGDILLSKVGNQFLHEFEHYLKHKRNLAVATCNKIIQKLKAMMKLAFDYGVIQKPAFPNHKFKHEKPKVVYLTMDELSLLEHHKFSQEVLTKVRDIFLFSVYTGLHYIDAMSLKNSNIIKGVDGKYWICYTRSKTDTEIHIPILERTQQLILLFKSKYGAQDEIVPRFSNQKINSYLKEIADISGIKKSLSHKVARKTFGSVLLFYNVPMKVVSKLMGHSSVTITERHYAQVELKKLGHEMEKVNNHLLNANHKHD